MAVNRSTEFVTLWAAPVMKYVFMEPLNRACARSAVLRFNELSLAGSSDPACSTYPRSPPHPAEEDDGLLAFHASGLIRKPVVDRPAFAIPAHVKANNGRGAVESDDPLILLHAQTLSDDLWSMNLSNGVGAVRDGASNECAPRRSEMLCSFNPARPTGLAHLGRNRTTRPASSCCRAMEAMARARSCCMKGLLSLGTSSLPNGSSAYPVAKMTLRSGHSDLTASISCVPLIPGIILSVIRRSTAPKRCNTRRACSPEVASITS